MVLVGMPVFNGKKQFVILPTYCLRTYGYDNFTIAPYMGGGGGGGGGGT